MRWPIAWKISSVLTTLGAMIIIAPIAYLLFQGASKIPQALSSFYSLGGSTLPLLGLSLLFASLIAYSNVLFLYYSKRPALHLLVLLLPLSFPTYIMAFNWAMVWEFLSLIVPVSRSGIKSLLGLSFVLALCLYPYILLPLYLFAKGKANNLLLQAKSINLPPKKVLQRVILPLSFVPLSLGAALLTYELLNDYGAAKFYGVNTLTTGIFKTWFGKGEKEEAIALSLILLAIVLLVRIIAQKIQGKKEDDQTEKSIRVLPELNGGIKAVLKAVFYLTLILALLAPLFGMLYGLWFDWEKQNFSLLWTSAAHSFWVGLAATGLTLALIMGLLFGKHFLKHPAHNWLNKLLSIGYSIPGAVIACGVLGAAWTVIPTLNSWMPSTTQTLYQSIFLLVLGVSLKLYAVGIPAAEGGWSKLGERQIKAAKVFLPYKKFAVSTRILKPQLLPYYAAAALFIFIDAIKELPLTLILRPFNYDTLATKAYNYVEDEYLYRAAPYSLLISLFCALGILLYNRTNKL
ncbi:MAG: ABC transporter permease [Luteibaculum sp.]